MKNAMTTQARLLLAAFALGCPTERAVEAAIAAGDLERTGDGPDPYPTIEIAELRARIAAL